MAEPLRIDIITTSRADYSILLPIAEAVLTDKDLRGRMVFTGAHFLQFELNDLPLRRAQLAIENIEVPCHGIGANLKASAHAMAQMLDGFADLWAESPPHACMVMGDRFELLPVVSAAVLYGFAIVHLFGGEEDLGYCLDTQVRDAITKMAHLHLVMHEANARRLNMMGEEGWRIKVVGNPAVDQFRPGVEPFLSYAKDKGWGSGPFIAACYLPPTTLPDAWKCELESLLKALEPWASPKGPYTVIWAGVNADPKATNIRDQLLQHCARSQSQFFVDGLGSILYPSLLDCAHALVGNSSSGLLESASHQIPVVNIGVRQAGRLAGENVLSVTPTVEEIGEALRIALEDQAFRDRVKSAKNPFQRPGSTQRIVQETKKVLALEANVLKVKRLLPDNPPTFGGLVRIQE